MESQGNESVSVERIGEPVGDVSNSLAGSSVGTEMNRLHEEMSNSGSEVVRLEGNGGSFVSNSTNF
jgi:hypothetical protein